MKNLIVTNGFILKWEVKKRPRVGRLGTDGLVTGPGLILKL